MKILGILSIVMFFALCGCVTPGKKSNLSLTPNEIKELCSKENIEISDSLRQRLIKNSKELKLTPEEMQVLKATGKVILCGKCGHILNSLEFKKHKDENLKGDLDSQGFIKGSLRDRIIGPYID